MSRWFLILLLTPALAWSQESADTKVVLAGPGSELSRQVESLTTTGVQSVVRVIRGDGRILAGEMPRKSGSGVVIEPGYVLTCAGVVGNAQEVLVASHQGDTLLAEVRGVDRRSNLALVHAPGLNLPAPAIDRRALILPGTFVVAVGIGSASVPPSTFGSVVVEAGPSLGYSDMEMIQTTNPMFPGYTGGALLNTEGKLIGIVSGVLEARGDMFVPEGADLVAGFLHRGRLLTITPGLTVSLPIGRSLELARQLKENGFVERAYLGIEVELAASSPGGGNSGARGVRVHNVVPGGPLARVGILPGDLILSFGDRRVENPDDLAFQVAARRPGMAATLKYLRRGTIQRAMVVLDQAPPVLWEPEWDQLLFGRTQDAEGAAPAR